MKRCLVFVCIIAIIFLAGTEVFGQGLQKPGSNVKKQDIPDVGCLINFSPGQHSFNPGRGASFFLIEPNKATCNWNVVNNNNWISITKPYRAQNIQGKGHGRIDYEIDMNENATDRTGTIMIEGRPYAVKQEGCHISTSPDGRTVSPHSEKGFISVSGDLKCKWQAKTDKSWISITSGSQGSGNGRVEYTVEGNPLTITRTGAITVGKYTYTITQQPAVQCSVELTPDKRTHMPGGGTYSFDVRAASGCYWAAKSDSQWVRVAEGGEGAGNGKVTYAIEKNFTGAPQRVATIAIGGRVYRITQEGCPVKVTPVTRTCESHYRPHGSQETNPPVLTVEIPQGCTYNAQSNADWIKIEASDGSRVRYSTKDNNHVSSRTATISLGGNVTHTVIQKGCPIYEISPHSSRHGSLRSTYDMIVRSQDCQWEMRSTVPWITIGSNTLSRGKYTLEENTGITRTGTITIGDSSVIITQQGRAD